LILRGATGTKSEKEKIIRTVEKQNKKECSKFIFQKEEHRFLFCFSTSRISVFFFFGFSSRRYRKFKKTSKKKIFIRIARSESK